MNNPYSRKEEKNDHKNNTLPQSENVIGLDTDEQVMNGLYGMPETNFEDRNDHK